MHLFIAIAASDFGGLLSHCSLFFTEKRMEYMSISLC